jgi:hypothetical protein
MRLVVALCVLLAVPAFAEEDPRVALGLVPAEVMEGARLFFEETFAGNGRTCGTCHLAESNTTIEPNDIKSLPPDAPLFALNVPGLEHANRIRQGLVLENVDGFNRDPNFRSVPHTLSLATSIISNKDQEPGSHAVGWSSDGAPAPGTLRDFATGAVIQHFPRSLARVPGVDFRLPTDAELDAMLAFQMQLGRTADIDLRDVRFADPLAERGRPFYLNAVDNNCQRCHASAGASRGLQVVDGGDLEEVAPGVPTGNQAKDTGVDALRFPGVPPDHGRGFPGDEQFSPPPLIEAADTAPFFHTASVFDVESAVRFYTTAVGLFSGQQQTFGEDRVVELGAVLRALNASFNAQLALQRIEAAQAILLAGFDHPSVGELLDLAAEEAEDGARVLVSPGSKHAKAKLGVCENLARNASRAKKPERHGQQIEQARAACAEANAALGTGLTMQLGSGNLAMKSSRFRP